MGLKSRLFARSATQLPDTLLSLRPGDFPIGSPESRAAAWLQLETLRDDRIEYFIGKPADHEGNPGASPWYETNGRFVRIIWRPIRHCRPGDPAPTCPGCGTEYRERVGAQLGFSDLVVFEANCLAKHIPDYSG